MLTFRLVTQLHRVILFDISQIFLNLQICFVFTGEDGYSWAIGYASANEWLLRTLANFTHFQNFWFTVAIDGKLSLRIVNYFDVVVVKLKAFGNFSSYFPREPFGETF